MPAITRFFLQFLIILLPISLIGFIAFSFNTLSKLETILLALLAVTLPWLFYELISRSDYQRKANNALLHFCKSFEKIFSSMSSLEKSSLEQPKEVIAELKILKSILNQVAQEKEAQFNEAEQDETADGETVQASQSTSQSANMHNSHQPAQPRQSHVSQSQAGSSTSKKSSTFSMPSPNDHTVKEARIIELPNPQQTNQSSQDKDISTDIAVNQNSDHEDIFSENTIETNKPLSRAELISVIETALSSDQIEMLIQPIVSLPQRKARHFECYSRIKTPEGNIYTPDHFVHLAEEENLIRLLDNAMLFRCIQMSRASLKKKFNVNFFCNVSRHTIADSFFFESLIDFFQSNKELGRNLILEFHEDAIKRKLNDLEPLLRKLKFLNCRFSVDQVTRFDHDIKRLKELNFKYIKLHSESILKVTQTEKGVKQVKEFKRQCNMHNIDVIVSHVENEEQLLDLNDFQFDFGQGYLFGTPVLSKN